MAGLYVSNLIVSSVEVKSLSASSSGLTFTGVDLINCPGGAVQVQIYAITGGTGTSTIAIEHSTALSTDYTAVPAAAILNYNTGEVTTLSTFSTTGTDQIVALNRELLRRYVRITISGTTLTQTVAFNTAYLAANTATS